MAVERLAELIRERQPCVVLTGAGVSTESGIPDFRSPTGIWASYDPMEYASIEAFHNDPVKVWDFYGRRLHVLTDAEPNAAHLSLARLERDGWVSAVVTQNIDMLHERAGSQTVIEVHGSIRTSSCLQCYTRVPLEDVIRMLDGASAPACPTCGSILKPDVVMFGELLPTSGDGPRTRARARRRAHARRGLVARGLARRGAAARGSRVRRRQPRADRARRRRRAQDRRPGRRDARGGRGAARMTDYDVVVVGSGFGGSVAALRLTEKGHRVAVLEAGRRFGPDDFPKTSWDARRYFWAPRLGCRGILRLTRLRHAFVLSGAGVGGGSLVYANVLAEPSGSDPELAPHYATVRRLLGATAVPFETPADAVLRSVAERMGVAASFRPTEVAVDFERCVHCGGCMVGCRYGAKNTLDRTYLRLAEHGGAVVYAEHEARLVRRIGAGWETVTAKRTFHSDHVVLAAGVLGTLPLLFRLPSPPPMLGRSVRTNTETLVGATADRAHTDFSRGVAITSAIEPAPGVVIQPVRYPRGSNAMALLGRPLSVRRWAERTVILLCMGTGRTACGSPGAATPCGRSGWASRRLRRSRRPRRPRPSPRK